MFINFFNKAKQMVAGSDVVANQEEATVADSFVSPDTVSHFIQDEMPKATDGVNDNGPEYDGDPEGGVASVPPSLTDMAKLDAEQKSAESSLAMAKKFLPKEEFELKYKKAFAEALNFLNYQLALVPKLNAIDTSHGGCRTDLKDPSVRERTKKEILWEDYGLKENTAWEIQQLTPELVKRIVEKALNEQRLPTRGLGIKIIKKEKVVENAEAQAEEKATIKQEKFEEKMAVDHEKYVAQTSQTPRVLDGKLFDVIWADPDETKMSINDIYGLNIPAAENAILFWWIKPGKLFETIDTIKHWGFQEAGQAVWNLEDQNVYSGSCFTQTHRLLLVATKGENPPMADKEARKKKSVYGLRPDFDVVEKPVYYRESIERMFPKGAMLDLFGTDKTNPKWTSFLKDEQEVANDANRD